MDRETEKIKEEITKIKKKVDERKVIATIVDNLESKQYKEVIKHGKS